MKKIVLLLVLCFPLIAVAQLEKGKLFVSGSIGAGGSGPKVDSLGTTYHNSNLSVSFGYLISDRWAIAISPGYNHYGYHYTGYKSDSYAFTITPYVRRYFSISDKFFFHLDGGLRGEWGRNKIRNDFNGTTPDSKSKGLTIYIQPGATYFFTNKLALHAGMGQIQYGFEKNTTTGAKFWNYSASLNPASLYIGATWYF